MGLVELYGVSSVIVHGQEDQYAAQLLYEALHPQLKGLKVIPADGQKPRRDDLVIYIGSFESNPLSRQAFKSLGYSMNWKLLTEGSFVLKTFRKSGKTQVFVAGKDRIGTLYAVHELKNYYLRIEMGRVLLNELSLVARAHLKYRWLKNLGSDTPKLPGAGGNIIAESGSESDTASDGALGGLRPDFSEIKKMLDFMSQHRLNGLVQKDFLANAEAATADSQELCRYANERGIGILPVISLGYQAALVSSSSANSRFNLNAWLKNHPELRAMDQKGNFLDHALCPEKSENRNWYREGLKWVYENFKIGGIQLELTSQFVCYSEDCKRARQSMGGNDPDYYKDMARLVTFMADEIHKLDASLWVGLATNTGFDFDSVRKPTRYSPFEGQFYTPYPPEFVKLIPDFVVYQWSLVPMFDNNVWPSPFVAPGKDNMGYLHWGDTATKTHKQLFFKRIQEITHHTISSNLKGLALAVEEPSTLSNAELNYLVFSEYAFNPATDAEDFFRYKLSRFYGGEEAAKKLLKILDLLENENGMMAQNLDEGLRLARQGSEMAEREGKERWNRLIRYLEGLK